MRNCTDRAIYSIDLAINFDTGVAGIGQLTRFHGVEAFVVPTMTAMGISVKTKDGVESTVPLLPGEGWFSPGCCRIRMQSLAPKTTANFIIACVSLNSSQSGKLPDQMFAERKPPSVLTAEGNYETGQIDGGREYPISFKADL